MKRTVVLLGAGLDVAVLACSPAPSTRLIAELSAPHAWLERVGPDRAGAELAEAVLWCAGAWLAIGLAAALVAATPSADGKALGRLAGRLAHAVLPGVLHRLVVGAAGLGIVLTPTAAAISTGAAAVAAAPAPAWPTGAPEPAPAWPTGPATSERSSTGQRAPAESGVSASARGRTPTRASVFVRPGDSLWAIAAAHLPDSASNADIARCWPQWYAANRAVIGPDPSLIRPGQVLTEPVPEGSPR